jgi:hypothetical protein
MKKRLRIDYTTSVIEILAKMGSLERRKLGKTVFLAKDGVEFARIAKSRLSLLNQNYSLYEFKNGFNRQGDMLLQSATESYWIASGQKVASSTTP